MQTNQIYQNGTKGFPHKLANVLEATSLGGNDENMLNHDLGGGRLIDVLKIADSDILHKVLDRFKAEIRGVHVKCHQDKFGYPSWRVCGMIGCFTNLKAIKEAELLLYGEIQND